MQGKVVSVCSKDADSSLGSPPQRIMNVICIEIGHGRLPKFSEEAFH